MGWRVWEWEVAGEAVRDIYMAACLGIRFTTLELLGPLGPRRRGAGTLVHKKGLQPALAQQGPGSSPATSGRPCTHQQYEYPVLARQLASLCCTTIIGLLKYTVYSGEQGHERLVASAKY
jgi:hypothetical protein